MRRSLPFFAACLLLVACGSDDEETGGSADSTSEESASSEESESDPTTAATSGADADSDDSRDLDCAGVEASLTEFGVPLQLLAQVRDPQNFQSIKDGVMAPLDIDAFLASIEELRVLEPFASPLGDPGESLDAYEDAGLAFKELAAKESVTQADIDEYNTHVGEVGAFLGRQVAIAGALDEAGC